MRALALLLLLAGCQQAAPKAETPGDRLEGAAVARGLVARPAGGVPTGLWSSGEDRLCILPLAGSARIGASIDYGEGQGCAASGGVERAGDRLRVRFGACRFDAGYDGDRITFPAELPAACDRLCGGRASLTALSVERLSESASEAATVRGPNGALLCVG